VVVITACGGVRVRGAWHRRASGRSHRASSWC